MVAGVQVVPMVWQLPQEVLVIGASKCALAPVVGRPAPGVALLGVSWQPAWVQVVADVTPSCLKLAGFHALVVWQLEHGEEVVRCVVAGVIVHVFPLLEWHPAQLVAPVWFILAPVHVPPMVWQLAQVAFVIGATVCALAPLVGTPARGVVAFGVLWQPDWVQLVAAITPAIVWLKFTGNQAAVVWQDKHWAVVEMCVSLAGVQLLPE